MKLRTPVRAVAVGLTAVSLSALPAAAQLTFTTSGAFSGACTGTTCSFGAYTLGYAPMPATTYGPVFPTLVDLGSFVAQASGTTGAPTSIPSGVLFTLTITQSAPSAGSATIVGDGITGQLSFNPSSSSLVWTPTTSSVVIGDVTYTLLRDHTGGINIEPPLASENPNPTVIKAVASVTATPEPATVILLGSGLAALAAFGARRRRAVR